MSDDVASRDLRKVPGAKAKAKRCVPNCCTKKRTNKKTCWKGGEGSTLIHKVGWILTIEIAVISLIADGFATAMPPTALVTEIAGVKIPSAIVRLNKTLSKRFSKNCWNYSRCTEQTLKQSFFSMCKVFPGDRPLTHNNRGHRALSFNVLTGFLDFPKRLSPLRVRSSSKFCSSGGYRAWNKAKDPPSPVVPRLSRKKGHMFWRTYLRWFQNRGIYRPDVGFSWDSAQSRDVKFTYLSNGNNVRDQMMALMPPMISSSEGTGPAAGQIPFKTYNGDVPMSE